MEILLPRVILPTTLPKPASYNPFPKQPLEELIDWEKRTGALDELEGRIQILEDSKSHQNF